MKLRDFRNWLPRPETDPAAVAGTPAVDPAVDPVVDPTKAVDPVVDPTKAVDPVVDPAKVVARTPEEIAAAAAEAAKSTGAPEAYADFTLPDGVELAPELLDGLRAEAKALNLDQAGAQKLVDFAASQRTRFMDTLVDAQTKMVAEWQDQTRNDAEIGGTKFDASVASAAAVVKAFGSPALNEFLEASGLGNHPEMVRMMAKVRAAISDDRFVPGGVENKQGPKSFYSASNMNP